jgi:sugar lactone lactonase YvrE
MTGPLSYLYTPNPRAIGEDSFSVIANDGLVDSAAATFTVNIRPNVDPGDIVFSDAALKRVMLVDPSGAHAVLSQDQLLTQPHGLAVEANRNLLVLDEQGGLIRIDCVTGQQSVLSSRTNFANDPLGGPLNLVIERSGMILVADGANGIVRVHPVTGAVSPLASGGHLVFPKGITVSPVNGDIYAGDLGLFAGQTSGIVRIDPITGLQTLVSSGGNLMLPAGLAMDNSGRLFVADPASFAGAPQDSLLQVDPVTGVQTVLATTGLKAPMGVATAAGGRLVLPNNTGSNLAAVARSGGEVRPVATGALMQAPFGIAVVHYQALDQPAIVGGHFTMRVTGEPGETYPIESTADFQSWTPAGSALIPLQGTITYSDPSVTTSRRFYRLIVP